MPRGVGARVADLGGVRERPPVGEALARLLVLVRQFTFAGPPTRRLEMPWPYSWITMPVSRSPSRSGFGRGPDEHLHARALAVGRRAEVRVVGAAAVLRLGAHGVVAGAAAAVVVDLEVAARLVEAVLVLDVVDDVVPVEQVRHRGRPVGARRLRQVQREVEVERRRRRSGSSPRPASCWRRRRCRPATLLPWVVVNSAPAAPFVSCQPKGDAVALAGFTTSDAAVRGRQRASCGSGSPPAARRRGTGRRRPSRSASTPGRCRRPP